MIAQCFFLVKYCNACDSVYEKKVLSLCYFVFVRGFTRVYIIQFARLTMILSRKLTDACERIATGFLSR